MCSLAALAWLPLALTMKPPRNLDNHLLRLPEDAGRAAAVLEDLRRAAGVADMLVLPEDNTVYLKVDAESFDTGLLQAGAERPAADPLTTAAGGLEPDPLPGPSNS